MELPIFDDDDERAICGVSGGETSALLAKRLRRVVFSFQNTSEEHAKTYDFIARVEDWLEQPIYRLEFRAPPRGEPPRKATFEIVEHRHLQKKGQVTMLEMLKAYRAKHKGLGPVAPWARSRICTAYLKIRTQRKFCEWLGWGHQRDYIEYVGLRADEEPRVARMRQRNADLHTDERAPLFDDGITKPDVRRFWDAQPFQLGLPEHEGNCRKCFLKDEADLATSMYADDMFEGDPEDTDRWVQYELEFGPMRRGGRPSYAQVREEAPARMEIRRALAEGRLYVVDLPKRRVKLIVAQERAARTPFSCECDAAKADDFDEALEAAS